MRILFILLLSATSHAFEVYPGCEVPTTKREVVIDAALGQQLQAELGKSIQPGDKVILKGRHKSFQVTRYNAGKAWVGKKDWIVIEGDGTAVIEQTLIRDIPRFAFKNVEFEKTRVETSASHLIFDNSFFYNQKDSSQWTIDQWKAAGSGIQTRFGECIAITNSSFKNVGFGITVATTKTLVKNNLVDGFSGDGARITNNDVMFIDNTILNSYLGRNEGDGNHDDGLQMFPSRDAKFSEFKNIVIEGNLFRETTDVKRKWIGPLQGIGHFDGSSRGIIVRNNIVQVSVWHGIALSGPIEGQVVGNSVCGLNPARNTWIRLGNTKSGAAPSKNYVANNSAISITVLGKENVLKRNLLIAQVSCFK